MYTLPFSHLTMLTTVQRITNARVKAGNKTHLLTLPEHLRHNIFRMAIVESEPILISTQDTKASDEPGLLIVSHDVCAEALKIFYVENDFDLLVHKTNINRAKAAAEMAKVKDEVKQQNHLVTASGVLARYGSLNPLHPTPNWSWMLEKQHVYNSTHNTVEHPGAGSICGTILLEPDWYNLVEWLKLFHAGKLLGPPKDDEGTAEEKAAFAMFDVVEGLKEEKWTMVERVLPGARLMLSAGEPMWLEGNDLEEEDGHETMVKREGSN